jgi:hypothetical protein
MIPVGTHGLSCLGEEDYAATALYMQDQALIIDSVLDGISDQLDTAAMRPVFIGTTTSISGPNSTFGEILFNITGWTVTYSNLPSTPTLASAGLRFTVPRTGWYNYGVYANLVAVGAVTALSRRTVAARATRQTVGTPTILSQATFRTIDTNTGGEFLVASDGSFFSAAGTVVDIEGFWSHTNVASNVQVNIGSKLWCHFIGSGVEIGSA